MTDIVKVKQDGIQVYPQTHTGAVENLGTYVDTKVAAATAVKSVNGKSGAVTLTASDVGALPSSTSIPQIPGVATSTTNGLMASVDKSKLDGIATGAQKNPGNATTTTAGLMAAADKVKLEGLSNITFEKVGTV